MGCCNTVQICGWIGGSPLLMARVSGKFNAYITQATISSINRTITNKDTGAEVSSDALVVADVVYDTLQTGGPWTYDDTGYNFADQPPDEDLDAAATYVVVYTLVPTSGENIVLDPFLLTMKDPTE